jgi:hypothetical protein
MVNDYFKPYREKREALAADPDQVRLILKRGAKKPVPKR